MEKQVAIRVDHLSKVFNLYDRNRDRLKESLHLGKNIHYREHYALNDISLEVQTGETVGIIGVTGAGSMIMTWSHFLPDHYRCGYAIGVSHSESGKITGPWTHEKKEIYSIGLRPDYRYDGGHAMMFYGRDGILRMVFHSPNSSSETYEHVKIMRVEELPGTVRLI